MKSQTVFWLNLLQMHEIQEPFHHHVTDLLFLKSSAWEKGFMGWTLFVYCPQFRQHSNYTKKQIFIVPQMIWSTAKCSWMYVCLGNLNKEEKFEISIEDFHFNIFFFWKRRSHKNLLKMCGVCGCLHEFNRVVISLSCRSKFNIQCEMKWWKCYPIN